MQKVSAAVRIFNLRASSDHFGSHLLVFVGNYNINRWSHQYLTTEGGLVPTRLTISLPQ